MRKILIIIVFLISLNAQAHSQQRVQGRVVDSLGQGIVGAVIESTLPDDQILGATTSDAQGNFKIIVSPDSCSLRITHLQYHEIVMKIREKADLGPITMYDNVNQVDAIVVQANFIKRRGADYTVSLRNNPVAVNRNALEFMSTLPGVNGLSINGKGSDLYVNGRLIHLPPDEQLKYLSGLRAQDVENITIIPSGGARYSASHRGGVIRITLRRGDDKLFSGSVTVPLNVNPKNGFISTSIPLTLNYTSPKFASYTFVSPCYLQNEQTENTYYLKNQTDKQSSLRSFYAINADQSFVYDINKKHSLGFALNAFIKPNERTISNGVSTSEQDNIIQTNVLNNRTSYYSYGGVATYQYNFGPRGSFLHISGDYLYSKDGNQQSYTSSESGNEFTISNTEKGTYTIDATSDINFKDDKSALSVGLQYLKMDARQNYSQAGASNSKFLYDEQIYSAYAQFNTSFVDDLLNLSVGLRYEGAGIEWAFTDVEAGRKDSKERFNNLFPSASFTYNMSQKSYLTLDYERSISRPGMWAYNPVVYRESDNVYSVGASHLLPEFDNALSLTQTINQKHTVALSYIWNNNLYDDVYKSEGDATYITSENCGSVQGFRLFANTKFMIIDKWLEAMASVSVNYSDFSHSTYGRTKSWDGRFSASLVLRLPKKFLIYVMGEYNTPSTTPIYHRTSIWGMDAGIMKAFGQRMRLKLTGNNILYSRGMTTTSRQADVYFRNYDRSYFQQISLSLVYNFGSSKLSQVKRAQINSKTQERGGGE